MNYIFNKKTLEKSQLRLKNIIKYLFFFKIGLNDKIHYKQLKEIFLNYSDNILISDFEYALLFDNAIEMASGSEKKSISKKYLA